MDRFFTDLAKKLNGFFARFKAYIRKLLIPVYLFPLKLISYSVYYFVKFIIKFVISIFKIIVETIVYPFKSLKNLLKSVFIIALLIYVLASLVVIIDYMSVNYGYYKKFLCFSSVTMNDNRNKVVRVVGGLGEGSGFFIEPNIILTNFHVIEGENSPKIITPDGKLLTPINMKGDKSMDLAELEISENYPDMVLNLNREDFMTQNEPLFAIGYPLGTDIAGDATILKGKYESLKNLKGYPLPFILSDLSLVPGMSGGPLLEACGEVVGVNTLGVGGISMIISTYDLNDVRKDFTDKDIYKEKLDPSKSPEDAVFAFYTYIGARNMEEGYNLLSEIYLEKTNFEEWINRFTDIIAVEIFVSEIFENSNDTVFVKFSTKNWINNEVENHFYEGTWETVLGEELYKMNKSNIKEIFEPDWSWFYTDES